LFRAVIFEVEAFRKIKGVFRWAIVDRQGRAVDVFCQATPRGVTRKVQTEGYREPIHKADVEIIEGAVAKGALEFRFEGRLRPHGRVVGYAVSKLAIGTGIVTPGLDPPARGNELLRQRVHKFLGRGYFLYGRKAGRGFRRRLELDPYICGALIDNHEACCRHVLFSFFL